MMEEYSDVAINRNTNNGDNSSKNLGCENKSNKDNTITPNESNSAKIDSNVNDGNDSNKDECEEEKKTPKNNKRFPADAVAILKQWMFSPEHFANPYPTDEEKELLRQKTGLNKKEMTRWFSYARRRIWMPMVKRQQDNILAPKVGGQVAIFVPVFVPCDTTGRPTNMPQTP